MKSATEMLNLSNDNTEGLLGKVERKIYEAALMGKTQHIFWPCDVSEEVRKALVSRGYAIDSYGNTVRVSWGAQVEG